MLTEAVKVPEVPVEKPTLAESLRGMRKRLTWVAIGSVLCANAYVNAKGTSQSLEEAYLGPQTNEEHFLSQRLSTLGHRVTVNCLPIEKLAPNEHQNQGVISLAYVAPVSFYFGKARLFAHALPIINADQEICDTATVALQSADSNNTSMAIRSYLSVGLLTHEYQHVADIHGSEAETECNNTQLLDGRLKQLGFDSKSANTMSKLYAHDNYRLPDYLSPECRPGGKLDLHVGSNYPLTPTNNPPALE